jgi:putative SOS response-associated peptidase YedK
MCGRYTLKTPVECLSEQFQFPGILPLMPRYNIAPSQPVAVVRLLPDDTDRKLAMLR